MQKSPGSLEYWRAWVIGRVKKFDLPWIWVPSEIQGTTTWRSCYKIPSKKFLKAGLHIRNGISGSSRRNPKKIKLALRASVWARAIPRSEDVRQLPTFRCITVYLRPWHYMQRNITDHIIDERHVAKQYPQWRRRPVPPSRTEVAPTNPRS